MDDHSNLEENLAKELDRNDVELIDNEYAMDLSDKITQQVVEEFAANPRVSTEQDGDMVTKSLTLMWDLDSSVYMEHFNDVKEVDVTLEYALSGGPDQTASEITIGWWTHADVCSVVKIMEGNPPIIETWKVALDETATDIQVSDLNGAQAAKLQEIMNGVQEALNEQETFVKEGRNEMHRTNSNNSERDTGSLD